MGVDWWGGARKIIDPGDLFTEDPADQEAEQSAAAGARGVASGAYRFSEEQWRRQMEGLQGAMGAYAPSQAYWNNTYGSQGPGAMENWWSQNQSQFTRDPYQRQAYTGYQDWMQNGVNATQQGANTAGQYIGGPTASSGAYGAMGQGLQNYNGPTRGQEAYNYNIADYQKAGQGENFYNQNQNRYNQETNSQAAYEYLSRQAGLESSIESFERNARQKTSDQQIRNNVNLMRHRSFAEAPTALQLNEGENKGFIRGANQAGDYYGSQLGALSGPGEYENFVSADIAGANPMYERTRERGIASINQEMARRGQFGAPASVDRIGNYTAELDAQDYQRRADRAQQAQAMQLARIGQGQQAAQGVSALDVQRGGALGALDTQSEQAQLGRQTYGLQAEQQMLQAEALQNRLDFDISKSSSDSALDRLKFQSGMAGQADSSNLNLLNAGQNASADAQRLMLERLMGQQNSANSIDQTRLAGDRLGFDRQMGSFNMAQGTDQSNLARANAYFGMGQGLDQNMMNRYAQQGQMAQGLDQFTLQQLLGGGQMAGQAQDAQQQRMMQAFGSLFGLNDAQAGQYSKFYGQGGELSGQAFQDAMSALMQSYGYAVEGSNSAKDRQAERQSGAAKLIGGYLGSG